MARKMTAKAAARSMVAKKDIQYRVPKFGVKKTKKK